MTPRAVLQVAAAAFLIALGVIFVRQQRRIGAQAVLLRQANSTARTATAQSVLKTRLLQEAVQEADKLRERFRAHEAGDGALRVSREAATALLASVRDSALAVAADSGATVVALREQVERLAVAGDSAVASHAREVEALRHSLRLAVLTIEADSTAIQKGLAAVDAAVARAVAAETQAKLLRRMLPSTVGGWAKLGAVGAIGGAAAHIFSRYTPANTNAPKSDLGTVNLGSLNPNIYRASSGVGAF